LSGKCLDRSFIASALLRKMADSNLPGRAHALLY